MRHPGEAELALYAGGDLSFRKWFLVRLHVKRCAQCREVVEEFGDQRQLVADLAPDLPEEVNWRSLAGNMKANIQLGLAAGECVAPAAPVPQRLGWRVAAAFGAVAIVVASGWWMHFPHGAASVGSLNEGIVLEATADGIELKEEDRALTLMHGSSEPVMLSVSAQGGMEAHYIDDETGMVTINNVYVQ